MRLATCIAVMLTCLVVVIVALRIDAGVKEAISMAAIALAIRNMGR